MRSALLLVGTQKAAIGFIAKVTTRARGVLLERGRVAGEVPSSDFRRGSMATVRIHGVIGAADSTEDKSEGSIWWFREKVGLNGHGFIPGTDLRDEQCSRSDYVAFWGPKNYHHGTRYKKKVFPRMVRRIRRLYQHVFQRPIGAANEIPYHFGKGLLAERKGYPIDWAAYARKMTHRGTGDMAHVGKAAVGRGGLMRNGLPFEFVSMEALRMKTPLGQWRKNEVDSASDSDEGSPNDWQVNVQTNSVMKPGGRRCQVARQTSPAHSLRKSPSTSRLEGKGNTPNNIADLYRVL